MGKQGQETRKRKDGFDVFGFVFFGASGRVSGLFLNWVWKGKIWFFDDEYSVVTMEAFFKFTFRE